MSRESELLVTALGQLPKSFRYEIIDETYSHEAFNDATIAIETNAGRWHFHVEIKRIHRKDTLFHLIKWAKPNTLLVCNPLTDSLAEYCEHNEINFIDAAGNARIYNRNFTTWITGRSRQHLGSNIAKSNPSMTPGAAKLIFALLANESALNFSFRELATLANVSLGMVSKGMTFLETHRHIYQSNKSGKARKFTDKDALTLLWIQQYQHVLRPKLGGINLSVSHSWESLTIEPPNYWGGEVAGAQLTSYLQPEKLQLFTFEPMQKMINTLRARPDETGNLWLVSAFWGQNLTMTQHAIALLSAAELIASDDSRNIETARMINEHYLHLKTFSQHTF